MRLYKQLTHIKSEQDYFKYLFMSRLIVYFMLFCLFASFLYVTQKNWLNAIRFLIYL